MKRAVRAVLALLAVTLAAIGVPGCGEPVPTITLWHAYRGGEEEALTELTKRWGAAHGFHVELLAIPFDAYGAKLEAAIPRAHGPDLFIDAHERLGSYLKNHLVAPIGDALGDADVAAYDASAVDAVTVDGVRYGVPLAEKTLALYLNEALIPTTPKTLEEITALRAKLPPNVYPLAYDTQAPYYHAPFLHAFGGRMLGPDDTFAFVGDAAAKSVAYVRDLTRAHVVPEEPSGALIAQLFASGQAAAVINGPWFAGEPHGGVKYRAVPLPVLAATGKVLRPFLTVEGAFVTPGGAPRPEVRALARWLGGDEAAIVRAKLGKQVVATARPWASGALDDEPVLAAFHAAAKTAMPMPTSTAMRATWVPALQALRKVLRGDAEPAAALDEARDRFADVMRAPPPPPSPAPLAIVFGLLALAGAAFAVKRAREPAFRAAVRASAPAYKYVAHAVLVIGLLVIVPLAAGTLTSFFAGTRDAPRYVGLGNYVSILTARGGPLLAHGSFWLTLLVTVLWTVVNVVFHVAIGVALGVLLSRPLLRLSAFYRVLLVLPWAVPSYVTALAWKGMFHRQFGAINAILRGLGVEPVSWFSHFSTALSANVATNVWLGFPFMMVVTLGALTAIPKEVLEAAEVDGATRAQRFFRVTLPLLKPALLPAVVLGAVWTFNMFNVVFLVSGGEPDETTDILVSEAYRWAFTRDAQYGYAAAYAVLIFFLLLGGSRLFARIGAETAPAEAT